MPDRAAPAENLFFRQYSQTTALACTAVLAYPGTGWEVFERVSGQQMLA
jgi:hypothetical protein